MNILFPIILFSIAIFFFISKWIENRKIKELFKLYLQNYRIISVYIEIYEELVDDCDESKKLQNQIWLNMFKKLCAQTNEFLIKLENRQQTTQDKIDMLTINKVLREHHDLILPLHSEKSFDQVAQPLLGWGLTIKALMKKA